MSKLQHQVRLTHATQTSRENKAKPTPTMQNQLHQTTPKFSREIAHHPQNFTSDAGRQSNFLSTNRTMRVALATTARRDALHIQSWGGMTVLAIFTSLVPRTNPKLDLYQHWDHKGSLISCAPYL